MRSRKEQISGDHYSKRSIQPFDIINEYNLDFYEGNALKYLLRHKEKNGKEDLLKLKDYVDCIIDMQYPEDDTSGYWHDINSTNNYYDKSVYVFKNELTDEQLKEACGEYDLLYIEADKLSVTTKWSLEEIVAAYKLVEYMADCFMFSFKMSDVLDKMSRNNNCSFLVLLRYIVNWYAFAEKLQYKEMTIHHNLNVNDAWSLYKRTCAIYIISDDYRLAIR